MLVSLSPAWLCCQQHTLSLTNSSSLWPQVTASSGLELLMAPLSLPQSPALPWPGRQGPAPVSSAPAIVKLSETDTTRHYPILSSRGQQGRELWYHSGSETASMMAHVVLVLWIIIKIDYNAKIMSLRQFSPNCLCCTWDPNVLQQCLNLLVNSLFRDLCVNQVVNTY